jgi:chromosome condensin MukBEF MukE localization factor
VRKSQAKWKVTLDRVRVGARTRSCEDQSVNEIRRIQDGHLGYETAHGETEKIDLHDI